MRLLDRIATMGAVLLCTAVATLIVVAYWGFEGCRPRSAGLRPGEPRPADEIAEVLCALWSETPAGVVTHMRAHYPGVVEIPAHPGPLGESNSVAVLRCQHGEFLVDNTDDHFFGGGRAFVWLDAEGAVVATHWTSQ